MSHVLAGFFFVSQLPTAGLVGPLAGDAAHCVTRKHPFIEMRFDGFRN
ncbi:MAG: hypothetical protein ABIT83_02170 [Massilia sp.]